MGLTKQGLRSALKGARVPAGSLCGNQLDALCAFCKQKYEFYFSKKDILGNPMPKRDQIFVGKGTPRQIRTRHANLLRSKGDVLKRKDVTDLEYCRVLASKYQGRGRKSLEINRDLFIFHLLKRFAELKIGNRNSVLVEILQMLPDNVCSTWSAAYIHRMRVEYRRRLKRGGFKYDPVLLEEFKYLLDVL